MWDTPFWQEARSETTGWATLMKWATGLLTLLATTTRSGGRISYAGRRACRTKTTRRFSSSMISDDGWTRRREPTPSRPVTYCCIPMEKQEWRAQAHSAITCHSCIFCGTGWYLDGRMALGPADCDLARTSHVRAPSSPRPRGTIILSKTNRCCWLIPGVSSPRVRLSGRSRSSPASSRSGFLVQLTCVYPTSTAPTPWLSLCPLQDPCLAYVLQQ